MIRRLTIGATAAMAALALLPGSATAQPSATLVFQEVADIGSGSGYVQLRNLTEDPVSLNGMSLYMCGSTGSPSLAATFGSSHVVPAEGTFLMTESGWTGPSDFSPIDGGVRDGGWMLEDDGFNVVDSVGFGDNGCVEGTGTEPWAPHCDGGPSARDVNGTDTDQNSDDFTCQ